MRDKYEKGSSIATRLAFGNDRFMFESNEFLIHINSS